MSILQPRVLLVQRIQRDYAFARRLENLERVHVLAHPDGAKSQECVSGYLLQE
ncbi:MAG TPA: hypothetical protein VI320_03085 [Terracidiphilus sp.]